MLDGDHKALVDAALPVCAQYGLAVAGGYFEVRVLDAEGRKGHLLVTLPPGGTYRVDVLKEPLNHPVVWMEFGPVIALADRSCTLLTLRR